MGVSTSQGIIEAVEKVSVMPSGRILSLGYYLIGFIIFWSTEFRSFDKMVTLT